MGTIGLTKSKPIACVFICEFQRESQGTKAILSTHVWDHINGFSSATFIHYSLFHFFILEKGIC